MATVHVIGKSADDRKCAQFIAAEAYATANHALDSLLALFGKAENIPISLKISDNEPGGWHGAEVAISEAVNRGDWLSVLDLTTAYLSRVNRFCEKNRQRFTQAMEQAQ